MKILYLNNIAVIADDLLFFDSMNSIFSNPYGLSRFAEIVDKFGIKSVVETGTFKGGSTVILAEFVEHVYSIELNPEYYAEASTRMVKEFDYDRIFSEDYVSGYIKDSKHITLFHGDSPTVLRGIIDQLETPTLFYLDAHWDEYWPILDELKAIGKHSDCVVIVHDIKVPEGLQGYEQYVGAKLDKNGANIEAVGLDFDLIKEPLMAINPEFEISYNDVDAQPGIRGILYALPRK